MILPFKASIDPFEKPVTQDPTEGQLQTINEFVLFCFALRGEGFVSLIYAALRVKRFYRRHQVLTN